MEKVMKRDEALDRASAYLEKSFSISEAEARVRGKELLATLAGEGEVARHAWWSFLMRGILAIGIGLIFWFRPGPALVVTILVFGIWVFIDGILSIGAAIEGRGSAWRLWLSGIVGIAVGVLTVTRPSVTATFLYVAIGVWAIVRGLSEVFSPIHRPREGGEAWLVVSGLLSIAFGVVVIFVPHIGAPLLAWLIGLYAIADGLVMVGLSLRIRHVGELVEGVRGMRAHIKRPEPRPT